MGQGLQIITWELPKFSGGGSLAGDGLNRHKRAARHCLSASVAALGHLDIDVVILNLALKCFEGAGRRYGPLEGVDEVARQPFVHLTCFHLPG